MDDKTAAKGRIDRLLDAIECLRANDNAGARQILHDIIQEDSNFEDAWLWMSVAVDSLDQTAVCLDNVLRINPTNAYAAEALQRIQMPQQDMEARRQKLRSRRDMAFTLFWTLVLLLLLAMSATIMQITAQYSRY